MSKEKKNRQQRAEIKAQKKQQRKNVSETIRYMLRETVKQNPKLLLCYLVIFLNKLSQKVTVVLFPKFLIDELMLVIEGAPVKEHMKMIALWAVLICAVNFLGNLLQSLTNQTINVISVEFDLYFNLKLSEKAMSLDFEQTEDPEVLNKQQRAREGISWYSGGVTGILGNFFDFVSHIVVLCGVIVIVLTTCPLLFPVQLISLFLISYFNAKRNELEIYFYGQLGSINRRFSYYLFEMPNFQYGKDIRLYDSSDMVVARGDELTGELVGNIHSMSSGEQKYSWYMDVINAIRDGFSYFYIGWLALKKYISIGDFTMCVASASELYQGMFGIVSSTQELVKRSEYVHRYLEYINLPETLKKGERSVNAGSEHVIEFCNVSFKYPRAEDYTLKNINLTIRSGEHLSVVGLNGAGKTTFIKLLCRFYDVTEGEIKIDGVNIREYSEEEYHKLFAVVFQDFQLFAFSLKENITFDNPCSEEELNEHLEMAGLTEDVKTLNKGVDTILYKSFDENGTELSGGQQQKTAICRALYRHAPIVILDEPTAALDPIAEYDIYRKFDLLVGGKTAIYISHRLSSCKFCDRIAVFADKTVAEYGTHTELVDKPHGIYAEMFAAQAQYYVDEAAKA